MKKPDPIKGKFNTEANRTKQEIRIRKRGGRLIKMAVAHFDKHHRNWVNQHYAKLLKSKIAPTMELTPNGQGLTPSQKATKAARLAVNQNFKRRIANIKNKVEKMVERSKGNDPTRPRGLDKGLSR